MSENIKFPLWLYIFCFIACLKRMKSLQYNFPMLCNIEEEVHGCHGNGLYEHNGD